ncbi:unnamed protein product [Camellia sinensis]
MLLFNNTITFCTNRRSLFIGFITDMSKLGRLDGNGTMIITTTMQAIKEKILSLNCGEYRTEIKSVDAQESYNGGFHVLVTGYLAAKDNMIQKFTQTFFLAPQERGYFVLNDMFHYMEDIKHHNGNQSSANDVEILLLCGRDVFEQTMVSIEFNGKEALGPSDDGEVSIVEEEVPVADIVDEVSDDLQMVVESNSQIDEMPNKSYASIVMDMKESAVPLSSPASPAPRRSVAKSQEQQVNLAHASASASAAEPPVSGSDAIENGNNQEGEADGCSIYIKGLLLNATHALLENEFKRFGPIKTVGVQVKSNEQGFCFGFVEFEVASAVQTAIESEQGVVFSKGDMDSGMRATEDVETMEAAEAILVVISMGGLSLVIGVVTIEEDFQTMELMADIRGMITWEAMIVGAQTVVVGLLSMKQPKLWHPGYLLPA